MLGAAIDKVRYFERCAPSARSALLLCGIDLQLGIGLAGSDDSLALACELVRGCYRAGQALHSSQLLSGYGGDAPLPSIPVDEDICR